MDRLTLRPPIVATLFALGLAACSQGQPRTETPSPSQTANPCAAKNVCAAKASNPCAAKNACASKPANPCAAKNVCAAKNPCAGAAGQPVDASRIRQGRQRLAQGIPFGELVGLGARLWEDPKLSKSGTLACANCHVNQYGLMQASFAEPYPHRVAMAKDRAGLDQVNAAEMVQLCMTVPMDTDPLPWSSRELAALAAYVQSLQKGFKPSTGAGNPGAGKPANPCAPKPANPCHPR